MSELLVCEQEACPFAEDGRCLEGLPNGEGCPHLHPVIVEAPLADTDRPLEPQSAPPLEDAELEPAHSEQMVELGGEDSLSVHAADAIAARWAATVVLIVGEHNAGKTTLLAELYGQFLKAPFCGWSYAGSDCLMALDRRYKGARGLGPGPPEIDHTVDEEMRLIDLRLRDAANRAVSLLLSDIKGEFVSQIIEGAPASEELPIAVRADRTAVVIDGEKVAGLYSRQETMTRARLLIGALTDPGGLPAGGPLAILLAKADYLDEEGMSWFVVAAEQLRAFADGRGATATIIVTASQPRDAPHNARGLDDVLAWLVAEVPACEATTNTAVAPTPERSFWAMQRVVND